MIPYSFEYSFTITLRPRFYKKTAEEQYDDIIPHIIKIMDLLSNKYTLIAELTKCYNIHLHGSIKFRLTSKNLCKYFHDAFRNDTYVGFVNIRQTMDDSTWHDYISKDFTKTYNALSRRPILRDHLDKYDQDTRAEFALAW